MVILKSCVTRSQIYLLKIIVGQKKTSLTFWVCPEYVLNMLCICSEYVLNMSWIYAEYVLNMCWVYREYGLNVWCTYRLRYVKACMPSTMAWVQWVILAMDGSWYFSMILGSSITDTSGSAAKTSSKRSRVDSTDLLISTTLLDD